MSEIPDDLKVRYKLANSQLSLLPPQDDDDAEEWLALRISCEETIQFIELIADHLAEVQRLQKQVRVLRESALNAADALARAYAGMIQDADVQNLVGIRAALAQTAPMPPMISDIALRDISSGIRLATAHEAWVLAKYASKDRGINDKAEVGEAPGEPEWNVQHD